MIARQIETQLRKLLPLIKIQLKALIARDLWDMTQFYEIFNHTDETVMKGLEIIQDKEYHNYQVK